MSFQNNVDFRCSVEEPSACFVCTDNNIGEKTESLNGFMIFPLVHRNVTGLRFPVSLCDSWTSHLKTVSIARGHSQGLLILEGSSSELVLRQFTCYCCIEWEAQIGRACDCSEEWQGKELEALGRQRWWNLMPLIFGAPGVWKILVARTDEKRRQARRDWAELWESLKSLIGVLDVSFWKVMKVRKAVHARDVDLNSQKPV